MSSNNEKKIQLTDSKETYAYDTSKGIIRKNEENKHNNIIKQQKIFNIDDVTFIVHFY